MPSASVASSNARREKSGSPAPEVMATSPSSSDSVRSIMLVFMVGLGEDGPATPDELEPGVDALQRVAHASWRSAMSAS